MIPAGDPVLDDLLFLSLETGNAVLSFTPPFPPSEVELFLNSIDITTLSTAALEAYNRVQNRLNPSSNLTISNDILTITFNINATIEAGVRFNSDISWYPQNSVSKIISIENTERFIPVNHVPSLLSVPIRFYFKDYFQLYIEPMIAIDPLYYNNSSDVFFTHNIPFDLMKLDQNFPLRAFAAFGGSWWNFQLGRDRLSWGTGHMGNLAISDNPSFYDFARASFFSDFFKYSVLVSQLPMELRKGIVSQDISDINILKGTTQRYLYMHRFDFSINNVLSIGLTEAVLVGNSAMELRYLNPLMIFHSLYSFWDYDYWYEDESHMTGSLFSLEVNWNIINSLAVYGQFVMNQMTTPYKESQFKDFPPNGLGFMAGARYSHSFNVWGSVFFLEFIYTDPYLYMNPSPFASYIHVRYLGYSPGRFQYSFLGFPRDTISLTLGARFFKNDYLSITGETFWISRGEHTIVWDWEKTEESYYESTPSGIPEHILAASVGINWKPFPFLLLKAALSGFISFNNNHTSGSNVPGGQAVVSLSYFY